MEQDPSCRCHLPPRSPSLLDLSSHRCHLSTSLLQSPATASTPRFGSSSLGSGSGSGSSSYQMPSSPLAPTSGDGAGVGGRSARHVRSYSQTSLGAGYGSSSSNYQLPPSPLGLTSGGGGSARHARSFSQTTLGSGSSSYFQMPKSLLAPTLGGGAGGSSSTSHHARSFSQPTFFSSLGYDLPWQDPCADLAAVVSSPRAPPLPSFLDQASSSGLQPRTLQSETTLFGSTQHELWPLPPSQPPGTASANIEDGAGRVYILMDDTIPLDDCDDIVSQYVDLDGLCGLNSSGNGTEEPHVPTTDSQPSGGLSAGSPAGGTGNRAVTSWSMSPLVTNINIAAGVGGCSGSKPSHFGSSSADGFTGMFDFETKPKLTLPSPGPAWAGSSSRSSLSRSRNRSGTLMDGASAPLVAEFANGIFTEDDIKKIKADNRLAVLVLSDPKRVKRILGNRMTAQKAKERKMKYVSDLERKVQLLQMEAKSLSEQVQSLQSTSAELKTENNELRIKLHGMEQRTHLTTALNEAITAEVQRLRLVASEDSDSRMPNGQLSFQMMQLDQLQHNQPSQPQQAQKPHWNLQNDIRHRRF